MTITTTTNPTIDFGPLLELRERYSARAEALTAGIANRDAEVIEEARQFLAEDDRLGDTLTAQLRPLFDPSTAAGTLSAGADGVFDVILDIRPTGDLTAELDAFDSAREYEVLHGVMDRVAAFAGDGLRATETVVTPPARMYVETCLRSFIGDVLEATRPTA